MEINSGGGVETEGGSPFQGNRTYRILAVALGVLVLLGALCLGLVVLGVIPLGRQAAARATATLVSLGTSSTPALTATPPSAGQPSTAVVQHSTATMPPSATPLPTSTSIVIVTPSVTALATGTEPPPPATAGIPTITPSSANRVTPATRVPSANTSGGAASGPLPGLAVTNLRYDPAYPQRNEPIVFYATVTNRTGKDQNYPLCAEIYDMPQRKNPLGTTNCDTVTIPPGTNELVIGYWIATGIKQCIPLRARVVYREQGGELRLPMTQTNGSEVWVDLGVCP